MKIYFDNVAWNAPHTGPSCFAHRLAVQLGNMGHQLADADNYDVAIVFIEATNALRRNRPFVHRLDGIWFRPDQMDSGMNDGIRWTYDNASKIVWQSEFDRGMTSRHFGERAGVVIRNGVDIAPVEIRSEQLNDMRNRYQRVYCCSSNWHPQKRLADNIELFRRLREETKVPSCLIVLGNNPDRMVADKDIFFAGSIRHDLCAEVYAASDWMLHLAWLDHCPNVCVEAIAQGCPIVCASAGGTIELLDGGKNGISMSDASPYDFSPTDYDNPPRVPMDALPQLDSRMADPASVDIVECAKKYEEVLRSIL